MIVELTLWLAVAGCSGESMRAQFQQAAAAGQGRVGVAATVLETGEAVSLHGSDRFPMQSVYKLPIGMAVLEQVDRGRLRLDQGVRVPRSELVPGSLHSPLRDQHPRGGVDVTIRELLRLTIVESDGTASDVLLRLAGGPEATPEQALVLLRGLQEGRGLSASSRNLLLQFLTETGTGPHRIKGLLPAGTIVAHKTGTSGTSGGLSRATNDIGLITLPNGNHLAIAVFVSDSKAGTDTRESVIAKIARVAYDCWGGR